MTKPIDTVARLHPSTAEYIRNADLSRVRLEEVEGGEHPLRLLRKLGLLVLDASDNFVQPFCWSAHGKAVRKVLHRQSGRIASAGC